MPRSVPARGFAEAFDCTKRVLSPAAANSSSQKMRANQPRASLRLSSSISTASFSVVGTKRIVTRSGRRSAPRCGGGRKGRPWDLGCGLRASLDRDRRGEKGFGAEGLPRGRGKRAIVAPVHRRFDGRAKARQRGDARDDRRRHGPDGLRGRRRGRGRAGGGPRARPSRARGDRAREGNPDRQPHQLAQQRGDPRRHLLPEGLGEGPALRARQAPALRLLRRARRAAPAARQDHRGDRARAGGAARGHRRRRRRQRGRRHAPARAGRSSARSSPACAGSRGSSRPRPGSSTATR